MGKFKKIISEEKLDFTIKWDDFDLDKWSNIQMCNVMRCKYLQSWSMYYVMVYFITAVALSTKQCKIFIRLKYHWMCFHFPVLIVMETFFNNPIPDGRGWGLFSRMTFQLKMGDVDIFLVARKKAGGWSMNFRDLAPRYFKCMKYC